MKPSTTTHDPKYLGTTKQLVKWKKKLSERQVKDILKVVHWFGLDFYTEDPEPDYDALKTGSLRFKQTSSALSLLSPNQPPFSSLSPATAQRPLCQCFCSRAPR